MTAPAKLLFGRLLVVLCLSFILSSVTAAEFDKADIDRKLSAIVSYQRGMDRGPLIAVEKLIRESEKRPKERQYIEHRLAALLPDATLDGKSFICKQLWFIGTADSVPAVAKLLLDEKTADMACYAIGRNPSPEAAEALRNALARAGPNVQIRIINVLGDRRDTSSVEAIGKLVFAGEPQVAEAAVAALGKISGAEARQILVQARAKGGTDLRFAATDAYLRCAEALVAKGDRRQATAIYRELSAKGEAPVVRSAAIKGLADIGAPQVAHTVTEALHDRNRMVRTTAVGCVRTMKGQGVTERFAAELAKVSAGEQVLLIGALADRGDAAALPAIIKKDKSADLEVRKAALQAIGKLGDASCVGMLVQAAEKGLTDEEKIAALNSLVDLQGAGVDNEIVKAVQVSPPEVRSQLIQVLSDRDAVGAVPALLGETSSPDSTVRKAAFKALGRLAGEKDLPSLVELLVKSRDDGSRRDTERAVITACRKITDVSRRADVVLAALKGQERIAVKCSLLRVLGHIANSRALKALSSAWQEQDPTVQDTAVRALANWPDPSAAEVLLGIYSRTPNKVHRLLALRGFARVLAMPVKGRPMEKTLDMCRQAVSRADNSREQKLVLSALANVAAPAALAMVEPFLHNEAVRPEAAIAAIKIARAIIPSHPRQAKQAMDNLLTVVQDKDLRKQAQDLAAQAERLEAGTPKAGK